MDLPKGRDLFRACSTVRSGRLRARMRLPSQLLQSVRHVRRVACRQRNPLVPGNGLRPGDRSTITRRSIATRSECVRHRYPAAAQYLKFMPAGTYNCVVSHPGYQDLAVVVEIEELKRTDLEFELIPLPANELDFDISSSSGHMPLAVRFTEDFTGEIASCHWGVRRRRVQYGKKAVPHLSAAGRVRREPDRHGRLGTDLQEEKGKSGGGGSDPVLSAHKKRGRLADRHRGCQLRRRRFRQRRLSRL